MPSTDTSRLYESFPHLARIDELWGRAECRAFLQELMNETRDGAREGFAPEHASTIFRLLVEHDKAYPSLDDSRSLGIWRNTPD